MLTKLNTVFMLLLILAKKLDSWLMIYSLNMLLLCHAIFWIFLSEYLVMERGFPRHHREGGCWCTKWGFPWTLGSSTLLLQTWGWCVSQCPSHHTCIHPQRRSRERHLTFSSATWCRICTSWLLSRGIVWDPSWRGGWFILPSTHFLTGKFC